MPDLDSAAKAAMASNGMAIAWFIFLDISGDVLRVTTYINDVTFAATGDSDLDGNTFTAVGPVIDVGDIGFSDAGSDTLTVSMSGIVTMDATLVADIGDKTKWQGRTARVWFQLYDPTGVTQQGAIVPLYTGYMSKVPILAQPTGQTIQLSIENYLASTAPASNRSYLNQADYDAADVSAQATIAAANGARHAGGAAHPIPANPGPAGRFLKSIGFGSGLYR